MPGPDDAHPAPAPDPGDPLTIGPALALWRSQHRLDTSAKFALMDGLEPVETRHSAARLLARVLALHSASAHDAEPDPALRLTRFELPLQQRLEATAAGSTQRRTAQRAFVTALVGMVGRAPHEGATENNPDLWRLIATTDRRMVSIFMLTALIEVVARDLDEQFGLTYHDLVNQLEDSLLLHAPLEGLQ